jgi:hypothetical protein
MTFNIQTLTSSIEKTGVAKASHFEVQCTAPSPVSEMERDMMYRAEAAEIPGRSLATVEHKFGNMGPITKIPYSQVFTDMTVTFLLSEDLREKQYFEIWQELMYNTGAFESGSSTGMSKFKPKYFDDYTGSVIIRQYGANGNLRTITTLVDAYPIIISPISTNWSSGELMKMNVTFAYRYYKLAFEMQDQPHRVAQGGISIGRGGIKANLNLGPLNLGLNNGRVSGSVKAPTLQTPLGPIGFRIRI